MKDIPAIVLLFLLIGSSKVSAQNVVVLFTDDQRFNTIRALGNDAVHTPNLDRLAALGVSFDRAHVQGSHHGAVCAPSRAMLLSGRPMYQIPRDYIDQGRADYRTDFDFLTFPEYFRARGYSTFFTGKWHNHTSKLRTGFERAENVFIGGMHWPRDGGHASPWLWHQDTTGRYAKEDRWQGDGFSSALFTDAALDFLATRPPDRPFCMYVAYSSPHDPRMAPAEFTAQYDAATTELPPNFLPEHPFDNGNLRIRDELLAPFPRTADTIRSEIAAYYAMISEVDAQIGRLLDELEKRDLLENTIIVFAGDNGLAVGQHGLLGKQSLYEHSVRVPLLIAAPGVPGGRRASTLTYLYDIFPTLIELTGGAVPTGLGGISLLPALRDESTSLRDTLYLHHARQMRAVRTTDDEKLILTFANGETHTQLFDLGADPYEIRNLASATEYAALHDRLTRQLTEYLIATGDDYFQPEINTHWAGGGTPLTVTLNHPAGATELRYTLDGSLPTAASQRYTEPFALNRDATLQVGVFYGERGVGEIAKQDIRLPRAVASVNWSSPPAEQYAADGSFTLVDGQRGSEHFRDGRWLGYHGEDVEVTVELAGEQAVSRVGLGYLQRPGDWIFPPAGVAIAVSADGESFTTVAEQDLPPATGGAVATHTYARELPGGAQPMRFVRYRIRNTGRCPDWHPGAGQPAWLFIDELIID